MNEGNGYDEAFSIIFKKWHSKLLLEYFGIYKGIPKFIAEPIAKLITQPHWTTYALIFVISISITIFLNLQEINNILAFSTILGITIVVASISLYKTKKLKGYYLDIFKRLLVTGVSLNIFLFVLMIFIDKLFNLNYISIDPIVMYHFVLTWYHISLFRNLIMNNQLRSS